MLIFRFACAGVGSDPLQNLAALVLNILDHKVRGVAVKLDGGRRIGVDAADGEIVHILVLGMAECCIVRVSDADGSLTASAAVHRFIEDILDGDVVDLASVMAEQAYNAVTAGTFRNDVANDDIMDVRAGIVGHEWMTDMAAERGQRDRIITGLADDVFDENMMAAHAQVDAVLIGCTVVSIESDIADDTLRAVMKGHAPIPLLENAETADLKAFDIAEEDGRIVEYARQSVFSRGLLGESVEVSAVKNRAVFTVDLNIFLRCLIHAHFRLGGEKLLEDAVIETKMRPVKNDGFSRIQHETAANQPKRIAGQRILAGDDDLVIFVDQFLEIRGIAEMRDVVEAHRISPP